MDYIEITTRAGCKNACAYCPHELFSAAYRSRSGDLVMRFETFKECVDKIPPHVGICFAGMGEPWLNPECTRMVRYAHSTGHRVHVFTTCVGLSPEDIDALKEIPFDRFVVHLPTAQGWESISVDQTYLSTLRCLRDSGLVTKWHCHSDAVNPLVSSALGEEVVQEGITTRAGNLQIDSELKASRKRGKIRCAADDLRRSVILPNGDVVICPHDFGVKHVLGNLREQEFESLYAGREFLLVQRGLADDSLDILCRSCEWAYEHTLYSRLRNRLVSRLRASRSTSRRTD